MPLYDYVARNRSGKEVRGVVNADTPEFAASTLTDRGLLDVQITEHIRVATVESLLARLKRISRRDIVIFARQLSVLVSANVPLVQSLRALINQTTNSQLQKVLESVADEVEAGAKLSDAMAQHHAFSDFMVNMIRSGETSGRLADVLEYLADQEEKDYDLTAKIRGAMMYPAFIVTGLSIVGFVMVTWVLPKLTDVLAETGAQLPLSTRILIGVSSFFQHWWWLVIILVVGAIVGLQFAIRQPLGRAVWDAMKIRMPIFGGLFKRIALVRFARSMDTLLAGGVDEVTALGIASNVVGNATYRDILLRTQKEVEDGNSIVTVMSGNKAVPVMLVQMLAVGEDTGKIREVLRRLAAFYNREIDNMVGNLVTLIEPLIMVIMGVAVGTMVAAVILPMYNIANSF
ncbi:type II secretion system F family protein [Patescibacteria group bacterium]|nr:MAG: type II secretion system F family protein [Patescibacteria group bacterium]